MNPRRLIPLLPLVALPLMAGSVTQEAKKAVAVLRFENNTGDARYDNLGRGLASMMISDLSVVEQIQLVERERLEELTNELEFQQSAHVDPNTAQTLGMFVGAEFVVTGAFMAIEPQMLLNTRIVEVETTEIKKTAEVAGERDRLFELQQQLAEEFIDGLALVLTEEDRARLREQQESNRIDDLETALAFSRALCLLDGGAYVQALEEMEEVRRSAPASGIVRATFDLLTGRVEEEAKSRLAAEANRRIGRLFGRNRTPRREEPTPIC